MSLHLYNNSKGSFIDKALEENQKKPTSINQNPQESFHSNQNGNENVKNVQVVEKYLEDNQQEQTNIDQNPLKTVEKFLEENKKESTNIDQHHIKNQVFEQNVDEKVKNISTAEKFLDENQIELENIDLHHQERQVFSQEIESYLKNILVVERFLEENQKEPTSTDQNPQISFVQDLNIDKSVKNILVVEKYLDDNQKEPTNIDQHHQESQVFKQNVDENVKNISVVENFLEDNKTELVKIDKHNQERQVFYQKIEQDIKNILAEEEFQVENQKKPTNNDQNLQESFATIEKFLDEDQKKPRNIDQDHLESQVLDQEIESYIKNINWIFDKEQSENVNNQISKHIKKFKFESSKNSIKWFILNQIDPNCLQWIDDKRKKQLNRYNGKIHEFKYFYGQNDQFEFEFELMMKIIVFDVLIQQIADMINKELLNLEANELKIIFQVIDFDFETKKDCFYFDNRFYRDLALVFIKNIYRETNNLKILETIKTNELIYLRQYLKKIVVEDIEDNISSNDKLNLIGLCMWIGPFTDQILDVIYLTTAKFYHPLLFYLYFFSFIFSLIAVIINVCNRVYKKLKEGQMSVSTPESNTSFLLIKKALFMSICSWLRIDELVYLLGYKKFFRNYFKCENKLSIYDRKLVYTDPDEILKQMRKNQKIEIIENIPQFFVLVINQTLLRDWDIYNLIQSCFSYTLMIFSIFKNYFEENNISIKKFNHLFQNVLFEFGNFNKAIGLIYSITVLCINLIALDQVDLLDDSSDLAQFQSKFRTQNIFAIVAIIIDIIHFFIFTFIVKKSYVKRMKNKNEMFQTYQKLETQVFLIKFSQRLQEQQLFNYLRSFNRLFNLVYSYFEISMYHTFYTKLSEADRFEFEILGFRFSYFMLIIFISTYVIHPIPYALAMIVVLIGLIGFILAIFIIPLIFCCKKMCK